MRVLAVRGSFWTLGGYGLSQVVRLGSHLVLAWLLAPEVFGLMALVTVFMQGMQMFSDVGIKPSIIQSGRGRDADFLNTAWTIQIVRGLALWACTCILAWPVAAMFARNDAAAGALAVLLPVAGFGTVIAGFSSTALATLNKDLRLGRLTMLELVAQIISLMVTVAWALIHPSVWAIIGGGLVSGVFKAAISHLIVPGHRVRISWDRDCARELFSFGKWVFLSTAFTFLSTNMDRLVLGNVLTLAELGLYGIALVFARVPLHVSGRLGDTVLFPVYAKYKSDPARMVAVALEARRVVLWAGSGTCLGMLIASPLVFQTLWDERYHSAGTIVQWTVPYIWSMIVLLTMDRIPLALGNSRALFSANIFRCTGIVLAVAGYAGAGLPGFLIGLAIGPLVAHIYLLLRLPTQSREVFLQGLRFTLGSVLYGSCALAIITWTPMSAGTTLGIVTVGMLALAPVLAAGYMIWQRVRSSKTSLRAPVAVAPAAVGSL